MSEIRIDSTVVRVWRQRDQLERDQLVLELNDGSYTSLFLDAQGQTQSSLIGILMRDTKARVNGVPLSDLIAVHGEAIKGAARGIGAAGAPAKPSAPQEVIVREMPKPPETETTVTQRDAQGRIVKTRKAVTA